MLWCGAVESLSDQSSSQQINLFPTHVRWDLIILLLFMELDQNHWILNQVPVIYYTELNRWLPDHTRTLLPKITCRHAEEMTQEKEGGSGENE